jgi:sugar O-acyltransferase (sialic acid O-acetyltransferase NeuD family)
MFIFGAGGHSKQCIDIFINNGYLIEGIFDDHKKGFHYNYRIIDTIDNAKLYIDKKSELFIGIGDNIIRNDIYDKFKDYNFINCISKNSYISPSAILGDGNYIGNNVCILSDVVIGNGNILNESCNVPHDCRIGNFNHISISSTLGGNVVVGHFNLLGLNSTILPNLKIGNNNILGAGSVLLSNISDCQKFVGIPAKCIN